MIGNYFLQAKNRLGGIKKVYLAQYIEQDEEDIVVSISDSTILTDFPATNFYEFFNRKASFNATSETERGAVFFNHSSEVELVKSYGVFDIQNLPKTRWRVVVLTNNGEYYMLGVYNGLDARINVQTGKQKAEFNGLRITFSGIEEVVPLKFSSFSDIGIIVYEGQSAFNYLLNLDL